MYSSSKRVYIDGNAVTQVVCVCVLYMCVRRMGVPTERMKKTRNPQRQCRFVSLTKLTILLSYAANDYVPRAAFALVHMNGSG